METERLASWFWKEEYKIKSVSTCPRSHGIFLQCIAHQVCELVKGYWHRRGTHPQQRLESSKNNVILFMTFRSQTSCSWDICLTFLPFSTLGCSFLLPKRRIYSLTFKKTCQILEFLLFTLFVKIYFMGKRCL